MAEEIGKKRKRSGDQAAKPKKKVVIDGPPATVSVSSVLQPKSSPPVIATFSGLQLPKDVTFNVYGAKDKVSTKSGSKSAKKSTNTDMMLHSNTHRSLDYTAKEDHGAGPKAPLNHFVGIYDPQTGKLQVVEAKKMIVRGTVRAKQASAASMGDRDIKTTMMEKRADLGQTFGTKKAKKAIEDTVLNAISPQKKPGDKSLAKLDDAARAMLGSVGEVTSTMASREELQAVVDAAKPVPRANLAATDIQDVYDPKAIIGADILNLIPVREWQEKVRHKEGVTVPSRFVAARVNSLAADDDFALRLRVLRYFFFVLIFYLKSKPGREKGTRQLLPRDQLREALSPAPEAVVENIRRKFSDAGVMRKFHIDLLMTHCCVFACIVDNFEVDTQNLRDDLRIDQKTMNQYFHEIGARVKQISNKEGGKQTTNIARLALPLDFPKQRHIKPKRR